MPATNQSAVSTLIREVLADPDLAHDDVFRRLLQAGLQDLVDAEAAAVIGAQRYERTPHRHQPPQRHEAQDRGHHRRRGRARHPQASDRILLPVPAPPAARRVDKALYAVIVPAWIEGVLHAQGQRPGQGPGQ